MQPFPIAPAKVKYKVKNWKDYNASLCRRGQVTIWIEDGVLREWRVGLTERWQKGEKLDIAIDSTGLKVFGEGDGAARAVEGAQARGEQAAHLAQTPPGHRRQQQIVSVSLTGNNEDDAAVAGRMIEGKQALLGSFRGDGAYDDFAFREKLGPGVVQIIPPPKDAVVHPGTPKKPPKPYLQQRNPGHPAPP